MIDAAVLKVLPPHLRERVISIAVESFILMELGPSPYRDFRIAELYEDAQEVHRLAQSYMPGLKLHEPTAAIKSQEALKQAILAGAGACILFGICIAAPLGAGLFLL